MITFSLSKKQFSRRQPVTIVTTATTDTGDCHDCRDCHGGWGRILLFRVAISSMRGEFSDHRVSCCKRHKSI